MTCSFPNRTGEMMGRVSAFLADTFSTLRFSQMRFLPTFTFRINWRILGFASSWFFFTPQTQSAVLNVFPFIQPSVLHSLSVVNRIGENDYRLVQTDPAHCMRVLGRFDARRLHSSPLHSLPHLPQTAMLCVYTCSYRFGHITALFWRN